MKIKICFALALILISCVEEPVIESPKPTKQIILEQKSENRLNWKNPALLPIGASIGNCLRAYYLVGQFEKMLPFLIIPDCMDREEVIHKLRKMTWGYEIDMTNVQWNQDSTFLVTYKTSINNTSGIEQYLGAVENDTAKLYIDVNNENLFVDNFDLPSSDDCMLTNALSLLQFKFDSSELLPESYRVLKQISSYFERNPGQVIQVIGHTSSEGSRSYNQDLSELRAKVIYDYLQSQNLNLSLKSYKGMGDKDPIYSNATEEGREKNRRVEILFLKN